MVWTGLGDNMKKFIAALLFVPTIASAEFYSGNDILNKLNDSSLMMQMQALGYIQGVADVYVGVTFCAASNVTAGQLQDIVKSYLQHNPAIRHKTAESLINEALKQVWPCSKRNGRGA